MAAKSKRVRARGRRQLQQELFRRGGKRRGAGRKPKGAQAAAARQGIRRSLPRRGDHLTDTGASVIGYVLSNFRKHGEDRQGLASTWLVDPFSSGILFPDWKELQDKPWMWPIRAIYDPLVVRRPRTWLLAEGWKVAGEISARDVPSKLR